MAMARRVTLQFLRDGGWSQVEVEASSLARRGGLRVLSREAEAGFGLDPKSYGVYDTHGKVDSLPALHRALHAPAGGTCTLEVREHPEWKMMSDMKKAMGALQDQVMAKCEAKVAAVREEIKHTNDRVCEFIMPMVQSIAQEQVELRAKFDGLAVETRIAQLEAERAALVAEDSKGLVEGAISDRCGTLADVVARTQADLDKLASEVRSDLVSRVNVVDEAEDFLYSEMQAVRDLNETMQSEVKALQADLARLSEEGAAELPPAGRGGPQGGALPPRAGTLQQGPKGAGRAAAGRDGFSPDAWLGWPGEGSAPRGVAYSDKLSAGVVPGSMQGKSLCRAMKMDVPQASGSEVAAPFARRTPGCRSLPQLPPLR